MRIRVLKPMSGVMDGVSLSYLKVGLTYDVPPSLALMLIAGGGATEIRSTPPALAVTFDDPYIEHVTGGITVSRAEVPDSPAHSFPDTLPDDQPPAVCRFRKLA